MRIERVALFVFMPAIVICTALPASGSTPETNRLNVVCTTTLLATAAKAVGGADVSVTSIIPCGMCPGHFDLTPEQASVIRNADIFLFHGFEGAMTRMNSDNEHTLSLRIVTDSNAMIPESHKELARKICGALAERKPEKRAVFEERLADYSGAIDRAAKARTKELSALKGTPVICSVMSAEFLDWAGLTVAATFSRDADMSIKNMSESVDTARAAGVVILIDNQQSSGRMGKTIAMELGVPRVVLTNFPEASGAGSGQYPYIEALTGNCTVILEALAQE